MLDTILPGLYFTSAVMLIMAIPIWARAILLYRRRAEFNCQMSGDCCRFKYLPLRESDVKRLEEAGYKDFVSYKGERSMKRVRGRCVFQKDDKCSVYEHRPQVCREYPFFKIYGIGYAQRASFCPAMEAFEGGRD